jgi:hypothetical protein
VQDEHERKLATLIMNRVAQECATFDFSDVDPIVQEASGNLHSFGLHKKIDDQLASVYYGLQSTGKGEHVFDASTGRLLKHSKNS